MDEGVLPLHIYGKQRPNPQQMEILKTAKANSGVTEKCKPVRAFPGCERALVFGDERPSFAVEWANTSWDDPKLAAKVRWALTGLDGKPHDMQEWFSDVLGVEVKEVTQ